MRDINNFLQLYMKDCKKPQTVDRITGHNFTYLTEISDYTVEMVKRVSTRLGFEEPLTYGKYKYYMHLFTFIKNSNQFLIEYKVIKKSFSLIT